MVRPRLPLLGLVFLFLAAGGGFAQTVSIVSGTGQVICPFYCDPFFDPLVVAVKDANGNPLPNTTVTWTVSGPGTLPGGVQSATSVTDANGQASITFSQPASNVSFGTSYLQSTVTASIGTSTATFYETTVLTGPTGGLLVLPNLLQPGIGATLTGNSGEQLPGAIQVYIGAPNVAVELETTSASTGPQIRCAASAGAPPGVALSDASGIATCSPIFGGRLGSGDFRIKVGNKFQSFSPFHFEVMAGLPCMARIMGGNNQAGNAGQMLPSPLVAEIADCGGNPLNGIPVSWSITQGSGTLTNTRTATANGLVSTNLTLGSVAGPVSVRVGVASGTATANNQTVAVTFNATVNLVVTQLQKVSGDAQDAAINTQFSQPLIVQVNNQGQPVAGVTVNFAVTSGSATVNTPNATTNAQGQASTTVTAGPNTGPVVVTASIGSFTQTFNLTVRLPGPANLSFLNGAGFQANAIAPCGIATITGSGLAPGIQGPVVPNLVGPMPLLVANVTVQFGTAFAPIFSVANQGGQESVTVQVPCEVSPGMVPVTIRVGGGSATVNTQVSAAAPGIFETAMSDNRRRAVLLKPDGTFVQLENPARRGEIIRMYVTGLGHVTPPVATNSPGIPDVDSSVPDLGSVIVGVNNAGVRVVSARYATGLIGVYEVAFQVPDDVPAGNLPLAIAVVQGGSLVFGNPSSIPVQ